MIFSQAILPILPNFLPNLPTLPNVDKPSDSRCINYMLILIFRLNLIFMNITSTARTPFLVLDVEIEIF